MIHSGLVPNRADRRAGFTLIEALAALAIAGAIFAVVAELTSQMLRNWNRGATTITAMEMLTRGLGRLETDLSMALPMRAPGVDSKTVLFSGDERNLTFVAATGFNTGDRGLELITISVLTDQDGTSVVRQRGPISIPPQAQRDPVTLLKGRMQVRFSFRDATGAVLPAWNQQAELPRAVMVEVIGASGAPLFATTPALTLTTNYNVTCLFSDDDEDEEGGQSGCVKPARAKSQKTSKQNSNAQSKEDE